MLANYLEGQKQVVVAVSTSVTGDHGRTEQLCVRHGESRLDADYKGCVTIFKVKRGRTYREAGTGCDLRP